ncbi:hypothetical protein [Methanocaldococcus sp.]
MDTKEILELLEEGYREEDKEYKKKAYFISYFVTGIILIVLNYLLYLYSILLIIPIIILIAGLLVIRQKKLYKRTKGYFEKIFEEILDIGFLSVLVLIFLSTFYNINFIPLILSVFFGFFIYIDGVLFKSKLRKILGIILILITPIFIFLTNHFLILGLILIVYSFIFLVKL